MSNVVQKTALRDRTNATKTSAKQATAPSGEESSIPVTTVTATTNASCSGNNPPPTAKRTRSKPPLPAVSTKSSSGTKTAAQDTNNASTISTTAASTGETNATNIPVGGCRSRTVTPLPRAKFQRTETTTVASENASTRGRAPAVVSAKGTTTSAIQRKPATPTFSRSAAPPSARGPSRQELEELQRARTQYEKDLQRRQSELETIEAKILNEQRTWTALQGAVEGMLDTHDAELVAVREDGEKSMKEREAAQGELLIELRASRAEEQCLVQQAKDFSEQEHNAVMLQEEVTNQFEENKKRLAELEEQIREQERVLATTRQEAKALQVEESLAQSSTYGLSDEAAAVVRETEAFEKRTEELKLAAIESEIERRKLFSLYEELKGTIRVYCRVKGGDPSNSTYSGSAAPQETMEAVPPSQQPQQAGACRYKYLSTQNDISSEDPSAAVCNSIEVTQTRVNATSRGMRETANNFTYDRVYSPSSQQSEIFDDVGPLVDCAVDGYKVCILAYGQTGSGKTYTMEGPQTTGETAGIIPRAIEKVYNRAERLKEEGWTYSMSCSFVEIYNDAVRDLLETSEAYHRACVEGKAEKHEIIHHGKTHTTITGVKIKPVANPQQVQDLLHVAVSNRTVAKTLMNERSSRSHCVFTMSIEGVNQRIQQKSEGTLCLVDLAGSERVNDSGAKGQQFKEAVKINKSLSALGDCICALGSKSHVSWRANKLTYLLQNYLGGEGAKMLMFVTISDKEEHTNETISSLRFAEKVNSTFVGTAKRRVQQL